MSDQDIKTTAMMIRYGGDFASTLARAALLADSDNFRRIKIAFAGLWLKYEQFVKAEEQSFAKAEEQSKVKK